MRRSVGAGLGTMAAVALAAAIWPALAGIVTGLLVTVLCAAAGVLAVLGGRRVRQSAAVTAAAGRIAGAVTGEGGTSRAAHDRSTRPQRRHRARREAPTASSASHRAK